MIEGEKMDKAVAVYLAPDLVKQLDSWRAEQPAPPARSRTVDVAVRSFLKEVERHD